MCIILVVIAVVDSTSSNGRLRIFGNFKLKRHHDSFLILYYVAFWTLHSGSFERSLTTNTTSTTERPNLNSEMKDNISSSVILPIGTQVTLILKLTSWFHFPRNHTNDDRDDLKSVILLVLGFRRSRKGRTWTWTWIHKIIRVGLPLRLAVRTWRSYHECPSKDPLICFYLFHW